MSLQVPLTPLAESGARFLRELNGPAVVVMALLSRILSPFNRFWRHSHSERSTHDRTLQCGTLPFLMTLPAPSLFVLIPPHLSVAVSHSALPSAVAPSKIAFRSLEGVSFSHLPPQIRGSLPDMCHRDKCRHKNMQEEMYLQKGKHREVLKVEKS